ncbi:Hypothetical protein CINCED_3A002291 [Cinara cedri]|uniref:Uncharacterized protein n=1 Tax=Cinara cedri TaxID=506608 RepID=A0A5E4ML26_9HEMI|nr:Hypothetical protein CINCED_3A002291 [Cinara cedri]
MNYSGSQWSSPYDIFCVVSNFKYKKCNDGRTFLMERNDIVYSRVKFLRKMNEFRRNNDTRPIVYLDESWRVPQGKANTRKDRCTKMITKQVYGLFSSKHITGKSQIDDAKRRNINWTKLHFKWAMKWVVTEKNKNTFKMVDVEVLVNSALDAITKNWAKCVDHCNKIQEDDLMKEGLRYKILEPIIITINRDDSSTDKDNDEIIN